MGACSSSSVILLYCTWWDYCVVGEALYIYCILVFRKGRSTSFGHVWSLSRCFSRVNVLFIAKLLRTWGLWLERPRCIGSRLVDQCIEPAKLRSSLRWERTFFWNERWKTCVWGSSRYNVENLQCLGCLYAVSEVLWWYCNFSSLESCKIEFISNLWVNFEY